MTRNIQQLFDLTGKTALVTGGSRGLGLQMAYALGEAGARVVISSRKATDLEEATAELQAAGIDARWIAPTARSKMTSAASPAKPCSVWARWSARQQRRRDLGRVGRRSPARSLGQGDEPQRAQLLFLSQLIAKASMIPRRAGSIINNASIAGLGGNPSGMKTIAYNTSKGAVINFTRALAAEWGEHGIRVNAICPGFFPSRMTQGTLKAMGEEKLAAHAPLRRLGDDEDLKGLTVLYASDAGKHVTGQYMAVDGGLSALTGG
jgi:gluconate 5-dehydrogenase